ncbi:MAG: hypothetical protein HRT87_09455 [Legionellales bacterium]|nr:hypothetical protein [Legionellales bacterium]
MPLIKKPIEDNSTAITFRVPERIRNEVKSYCKFAILKEGDFYRECIKYILEKDKDWKKYKKENNLKF